MEEEGASENLEDDADLLNMDQNNQLGGIDQEQLTAEEKEVVVSTKLCVRTDIMYKSGSSVAV